VRALEVGEYGDLTVEQRVSILSTLVHLALDGPSVRATLEQRLEEVARVRRFMWEEAKVTPAESLALAFDF
jgi:WSTF, HB1, Itc1p, MBD9 motif 1